MSTDLHPNPNIAALMRLNARLHKRVDVLYQALERIAGPEPCSGAMTHDETGNPFTPETAESIRRLHAGSCHRCVARAAMDNGSDLSAANPCDRYHVFEELDGRCGEQDTQWGGPEHDDTHLPHDWINFMRKFLLRITDANTYLEYEDNMFDVGALAVQAIQSCRRKRLLCTDCKALVGAQHKPHCHRQGLVTKDSVYIHNLPRAGCKCANPGVDLTTGVCDCVEPVRSGSIYCPCHGKTASGTDASMPERSCQ